jgi:CBS domain-containing protein
MYVGDILRKTRVVTVRMNETVGIAAKLMLANKVSALVVDDVVRARGDTAAGLFTKRAVVHAVAEHGVAGLNMKVARFVSVQQPLSCNPQDTLERVQDLMNRHRVRHLPVIDNCSLVGVISTQDIASALETRAAQAA